MQVESLARGLARVSLRGSPPQRQIDAGRPTQGKTCAPENAIATVVR